jgi:aldehyde:ferredoxin oxidoreductase
MHVKGLELGMHEPRLKHGLAISYAVNAIGGDHMATIHDPLLAQEGPNMEKARSIGISSPLRIDDMGPAKVSAILKYHYWRMFGDSAILCHFVPWTFNQEIDIIRMLTGWDFGGTEALQVGERVATMGRAFNMREGLTAANDTLPKRFFSGTPRGALKDSPLDPDELRQAVNTFYQMSGWESETGLPTPEKLAELGLSWVDEQIRSLRGAAA